MSPELPSPQPNPETGFDHLEVPEQHSLLQARQRAARNIFEEVAQNPSAHPEIDYEKARDNKTQADQRLTDFEIAHGFIKPPEE